jgi:hypothetical protein
MRLLIILSLLLYYNSELAAQNGSIEVELSASVNSTPEALMDLLTLSFDTILPEPFLVGTIRNKSSETAHRLYMDIIVSSRNEGVLLHSFHETLLSFSIPGNDFVSFNDKEIASGSFSGSSAGGRFNFLLTERGQRMINRLQRGLLLPADHFTIEVKLSEGAAARNGGILISSNSVTFDLDLLGAAAKITAPERVVEQLSNIDLTQEEPQFMWSGLAGQSYRLVVIEDTPNNNVELLLEYAFGRSNPDSIRTQLTNFEYLDVIVKGNSYTMPASLSKQLDQGKNYVWQVRSKIETPNGAQEVKSDIWRFTVNQIIKDEVTDLLIQIYGQSKVDQMMQQGLQLDEIEIDGKVYKGQNAVRYLRELVEKINQKKATVVN